MAELYPSAPRGATHLATACPAFPGQTPLRAEFSRENVTTAEFTELRRKIEAELSAWEPEIEALRS